MTNLEYLVTKKMIDWSDICVVAYKSKHNCSCTGVQCIDCEFYKNTVLCLQTISEEHKETIKLTQWEKDMLEARINHDSHHCDALENNLYFLDLKNKGYFKNVDLSKTAKEILENCEVVEND